MRAPQRLLAAAFVLASLVPGNRDSSAATILIVNNNSSGAGLSDNTPATPVGGNNGTTLGQQRTIALEEAARLWATLLPSDVTIRIDASFVTLPCDATTAVLASAGSRTVHLDFPGAEFADTYYHAALANKLAGRDLNETTNEIRARFNVDLGGAQCFSGSPFYLGLDNNHGTAVDLISVALHEFAHGLGFSSFVDGATGELFMQKGDVFSRYTFDNLTGKTWNTLTSAERRASAISGTLAWSGANTTAYAIAHLARQPRLLVSAPSPAAGSYPVGTAEFGPSLTVEGVTGTLVLAQDGAGTSPTDGCEAITNGAEVAGRIVLIDRGTCNFTVKVKNAQNVGARAVVIADNAAGSPPAGLGGTDATVMIPSVRVTQADGAVLKANLPSTVTLGRDPNRLAGGDAAGRMLLYAPNPYAAGSSVSHFDTSVSPNALMEPNISSDLPRGVDATIEQLKDIGWYRAPSARTHWLLPTSARIPGVNSSFFTADLFVANTGTSEARFTLKFLGHDQDGRNGPERDFTLGAGRSVKYTDVLGSVFSLTNDFGAIRISSESAALNILGQISTPPQGGGAGSFGNSFPAFTSSELIVAGTPRSIVGIQEDAAFRTNLILANGTESPLDMVITLIAADGTVLGTLRSPSADLPTFRPLEMRQISRIAEKITGSRNVALATAVLSTPTTGGAFAAIGSLIQNDTNDPRTLLAR